MSHPDNTFHADKVSFFSEVDHLVYSAIGKLDKAEHKVITIGCDPGCDVVIRAPRIPDRLIALRYVTLEKSYQFSALHSLCLPHFNGKESRVGNVKSPFRLRFPGVGELSVGTQEGKVLPEFLRSTNVSKKFVARSKEILKDRYRMVREIGVGGFGRVLLADDIVTQGRVAIKMINNDILADQKVIGSAADRFFQEIQILTHLKHPNITQVIDFGVQESSWQPYYVMEFIEGVPVTDYLDTVPIDDRFAIAESIFTQLLDGVAYLHENGILHRDLKPSNILVQPKDLVVKVLDFGCAKILESGLDLSTDLTTRTFEWFGTPPYMSPEQSMNAKNMTSSSDVYTLGILASQIYGNIYPYNIIEDDNYEDLHLNASYDEEKIDAHLPSHVSAFVKACLRKEPRLRPQNAREALKILKGRETSIVVNSEANIEHQQGDDGTYLEEREKRVWRPLFKETEMIGILFFVALLLLAEIVRVLFKL